MASTLEEQRTLYPLPVYSYRVTVDDQTLSFSEVSGIKSEYDTVTYRHGLSFTEGERIQTFRFDSYFPITLRRGVLLGSKPLFLYQWLESRENRPVEVSLCDASGAAVIVWRIAYAVAVKVDAPSFDAASSEVAIEGLELQVRGVSMIEI